MANNDTVKSSDPHADPASMPGGVATIPPSTFYGTQNQRPVPNRPAAPSVGSASTGHYTIQPSEKSPFREPELVSDESGQLPALADYAANQDGRPFDYDTPPQEGVWPSGDASSWPSQGTQYYGSTSTNPFASTDRWLASGPEPTWGSYEGGWVNESTRRSVTIDGRNESEETLWWNAQVRSNNTRPGHGILPPVLADNLHHPEHTLFSVTVTPPDFKLPVPPAPVPSQPQPASSESPKLRRSTDSASSLTGGQSSHAPYPPTAEEVRIAVPHPNAYYCRKHNGWVLLIWKSSTINPPFSRSFKGILPDPGRRRLTNSCIGDGEQPLGPDNITHHFHAYERAVDAHRLPHPFNASQWETEERSKLRYRKMTLRGNDPASVMSAMEQVAEDTRMDVDQEEGEGDLLDLYVCCQCSFYVVSSDVIPGVVPVKLIEDLVKSKMENPPPDKCGEFAVLITLETILKYVYLCALWTE
jgi:ubiquitin carboxyl-terminal hydrolase 25